MKLDVNLKNKMWVVCVLLLAGFIWVWLTDAIDINKRGDVNMKAKKCYYECELDQLNLKIYEQEQCYKNIDDPKLKAEIRGRILGLKIEKQYYERELKRMI